MKLSTAILLTGVSVTGVGVARIVQEARHQRERNEALAAGHQIEWLSRVSTNADLAKVWAKDGMDIEAYQEQMTANRMLCQLSLRHRLGLVSDQKLPFFARVLMENKACKRYWDQFGALREEEAEGDRKGEQFTRAMSLAAQTA
ncbi:DUF6082 family protein [Streptomyces anulatus]|uniref:DUF6082 family protein n=1 Tax=Streptomyces anulatus TaxID=1892 RepID=UPI00386CA25D|nr:DUF6082 family protein [Streptomyces anulatus]WSW80763.1 DUF6082 family protein [Streptomyces anulatus]